MADSKIYEVRIYKCKPDEFQSFVKLVCSPEYSPRLQTSTPFGIWRSEIGNLNELFHIWGYDSLAHRASLRKKLSENENWLKVIPKLASKWVSQVSQVTKPVSRIHLEPKFSVGVFFYLYTEDQNYNTVTVDNNCQHCVTLLGAFKVFIGGPYGAKYFVFNARSLDDVEEFMEASKAEFSQHSISMTLLHALPVSPLQ